MTEVGETEVKETFQEPISKALKFKQQWTLWEFVDGKTEDVNEQAKFASQNHKVCWFNDASSFAKAYATVPHFKVENVFYNSDKGMVQT